MAYDVTSQWDDIHRRLGNYEELPVEKKQAEFSKEAIEAMEKYDPLAEKNLDELDEMEDDLDEEFLKKYKEQRLQEMQGDKEKPKFSGVREITKQDYVDEVTNAPKGTYVIIHLYQTYIEACGVMNQVFDELAPKYPQLKFVRIVATKCIENYPDINCPTIIIYLNGGMVTTLPRIDKKYSKITVAAMENCLQNIGILPKKDTKGKEMAQNYKSMLII
jgi:thiol-disulfide isomerase/thioredoxin